MTHLTLTLLNTFHAAVDDRPVEHFRSVKVQALLAYLAVEAGCHHRRQTLATLFWPDVNEATAQQNLRTSLYRLRQLLGDPDRKAPLIETTRETVRLNAKAGYTLDVAQFEHACELGEWRRAAALYSGEFLTGFCANSAPFEEWALLTRERLHQQYLSVLDKITANALAARDASLALQYGRRQLALEPWREKAHRQVMQALAQQGDRSGALAQYELCSQQLMDEFGVGPSAETNALYDQIEKGEAETKQNEPTEHAVGMHRFLAAAPALPAPPSPLVGRDRELAELAALLADPRQRLVTLLGPGGIGKTQLALAAAAQAKNFPDGVYFVSLSTVDGAEAMESAIANALNLPIYQGQTPAQQLHNYLREKRVLLLLDNFEHLSSSVSILVKLLQALPRVTCLVTSRTRLNILHEHLFWVEGLEAPPPDVVDPVQLGAYTAIELFCQCAERTGADFELTEDALVAVAEICRLLHGMPLAILLAASWIELLTPAEILAQLEEDVSEDVAAQRPRFDFLESNFHDLPERQRSLRAVFNHTWELLTERERSICQQLAIFRGGFSLEAAQKVTQASLPELRSLVNKSLLRHASPRRYVLHEALRQYALEKLAEQPKGMESVQARHSSYYMRFIAAEATCLDKIGHESVLESLTQELDNIRAAWNWAAIQGDDAILEDSLDGVLTYYRIRGFYQEGASIFGYAATQLKAAPNPTAARARLIRRLYSCQAYCWLRLGKLAETRALLHELLRAEPDQPDVDSAYALWTLGYTEWHRGEYDESVTHFRESLRIFQAIGDEKGAARALNQLGVVTEAMGDVAAAKQFYNQSLAIYRRLELASGVALTLHNLSDTERAVGNLAAARELAVESLEIRRAINDHWGIAFSLNNLANIARDAGDLEEAISHYAVSLSIRRQIGNQWGIANSLKNMGHAWLQKGQPATAHTHYLDALQISVRIESMRETLEILSGLGQLLATQAQPAEAYMLFAFVLHHPAAESSTKQFARKQQAICAAQLSVQAAASAQSAAQQLTIERVVNYVILGSGTNEQNGAASQSSHQGSSRPSRAIAITSAACVGDGAGEKFSSRATRW